MKEKLTSLSDLASVFGKNTITTPTNETSSSHDENLVYSTDSGRIKPNKSNENVTSSDGYAKVRRETKGRKGKGVVTISGLGLDNNALKTLAKKLKKTCGTGGTVIEEVIEIQGDKRDEIKAVLEKEGFKVKFIGG